MPLLKIFLRLSCFLFPGFAFAQPGQVYQQDIKTDISLPAEAGKNVVKLFQSKGQLICVTSTGVFRHQSGKWAGYKQSSDLTTAALDLAGNVWYASAQAIYAEKPEKKFSQPPFSQKDTILTLFWETSTKLFVGTNNSFSSGMGNGLLLFMSKNAV